MRLDGYDATKCIGYDGSLDLYMVPCTGGEEQSFVLRSNGLIVWGETDLCLVADNGFWPKLRACDISDANQLWSYGVDRKFKASGGTRCLDLLENNNNGRLKVDNCGDVTSTWYTQDIMTMVSTSIIILVFLAGVEA